MHWPKPFVGCDGESKAGPDAVLEETISIWSMPDSSETAVLLVFAKEPKPGHVKTRLAGATSDLNAAESARLYTAFLRDALRQYAMLGSLLDVSLDIHLYWAGDPAHASVFTEPHEGNGSDERGAVTVRLQEGDGLGPRMRNAFQNAFNEGYSRAVVIGTDHPTLPTPYIEEAYVALRDGSSVCIGPSTDGGYYLLGMSRYVPAVFEDMTYSHSHVFKNTLRRAARTDADVVVLPEFYDVDTPDTLRRMLMDLRDGDAAAPHTRSAARDLCLYHRFDISTASDGPAEG